LLVVDVICFFLPFLKFFSEILKNGVRYKENSEFTNISATGINNFATRLCNSAARINKTATVLYNISTRINRIATALYKTSTRINRIATGLCNFSTQINEN
jgi:hypothetical protein